MDKTLESQLSFLDEVNTMDKPKQTYSLRPYQEEAVRKGVEHLLSGRKPAVMVLPMGAGKSLILANIAKQLNGHVLIFQPSQELLTQNRDKLLSYNTGIDIGIFSASFSSRDISKITFATIGSVYRNPSAFSHFQYILIDECDGGIDGYNDSTMYRKFFNSIGDKSILGVTATCFRLYRNSFGNVMRWLTRTSPRFFYDMIYHIQIQDLLDMGFLCGCNYYSVKGFDVNQLRVNANGSDFTDNSIKLYYKQINYDNSILDVCKRLINVGRKNILVFTKFVDEAQLLVSELGDIAAVVSAKTPKKERVKIISDFKSGKIRICANAALLGIGFDFPELETVVMARPTLSLRIWMQFLGRAIRPHMFKENAWIVDMADNMNRFPELHNLWIKHDNKNQWAMFDKKTGRQLTNVYY